MKEDVNVLSKYEKKLDEAFMDVDFEFFDKSVEILDKRSKEVEVYYKDILNKPFDFDKDEDYQFNAENLDYAKNKDELKERWRKSLKYETMARLYNLVEDQEKADEKSDTVTIKSFEELEEEAREKSLSDMMIGFTECRS